MTISLTDLASAASTYIDEQVEVKVINVTANLEPGEEGTYTVRVTNAGAPNGIRLEDVVLHITVEPATKAQLKPIGSAAIITRATGDIDDPRLSSNDEVDAMFVFLPPPVTDFEPNATLDAGEEIELEFEYVAKAAGDVTISCHVHATVDVDSVFPRSSGSDGERTVTVRP